jgi:acetyl-CoA acetyltransferase
MHDVAIIGVGLHPFGRFKGKTAMEMGVDAITAAVADAGVTWNDIQFGVGGSWTVANPDAIVGMVGLSGIPFTNVFNACATAASATKVCPTESGWATTTSASPSGWTNIPGLRQLHEIIRQLRGEAGERQIPGEPKVGFAQLYGAPGTAGATILTT